MFIFIYNDGIQWFSTVMEAIASSHVAASVALGLGHRLIRSALWVAYQPERDVNVTAIGELTWDIEAMKCIQSVSKT